MSPCVRKRCPRARARRAARGSCRSRRSGRRATLPSSFAIGWSPVSRSMIASRRAASPTRPVDERAVGVGPAVDERRAHRGEPLGSAAPSGDAIPQIPHMRDYSSDACCSAEFGAHQELQLLLGCSSPRRRCSLLARPAADPVPDPARPRRARCSASRRASRTSRCRPDLVLVGDPAAASLLRRVLHRRSASCARTCGRSRCSRSASSSRRRSRSRSSRTTAIGPAVGGRASCSARSSRRPTRSPRPSIARRLGVPRRAARDHRGREPRQRRHRARALQVRRRRGRHRDVLARRRGRELRLDRRRRHRRRARRRLRDPAVRRAARQPAARDHDRASSPATSRSCPPTAIGASGVLAAVTAGVYLGWHTPELTTVETRLQGARSGRSSSSS